MYHVTNAPLADAAQPADPLTTVIDSYVAQGYDRAEVQMLVTFIVPIYQTEVLAGRLPVIDDDAANRSKIDAELKARFKSATGNGLDSGNCIEILDRFRKLVDEGKLDRTFIDPRPAPSTQPPPAATKKAADTKVGFLSSDKGKIMMYAGGGLLGGIILTKVLSKK